MGRASRSPGVWRAPGWRPAGLQALPGGPLAPPSNYQPPPTESHWVVASVSQLAARRAWAGPSWRTWLALVCLWRLRASEAEVAHAWGRLSLCLLEWPHPRIPCFPPIVLWGLLIAQQEKTDSRRVQGPGLGARLGWPRRQHQPPTSGPCLPIRQELKHIGIQVANDRDKLHNDNSSSCCTESPGTQSGYACPYWSSDSPGHVLLLSVRQEEGRGQRG